MKTKAFFIQINLKVSKSRWVQGIASFLFFLKTPTFLIQKRTTKFSSCFSLRHTQDLNGITLARHQMAILF
jgi:hypothetical protein